MGVVLSGVQPTGHLHLGNYSGAISQWVDMQQAHECLFCIVDLHAITVPQDPTALREATLRTAAFYIACGVDPKQSVIFHQSAVPEHAELAWLLSCITPLGWLQRMTQYKDKAGKHRDQSNLGLLSYPVLMAADILLYDATHVPVGEDQKQHLELARDISGLFNRQYDGEYLTMPEPMILPQAARIMSLRDGTKKMSKSDPSDASRLHLSDSDELLAKKIAKAKSDMVEGFAGSLDDRPEAKNLLTIYASMTNKTLKAVQAECADMNFASFKKILAEAVIAHLSPIRNEYEALMADQGALRDLLNQGAERARVRAAKKIHQIKEVMGFL